MSRRPSTAATAPTPDRLAEVLRIGRESVTSPTPESTGTKYSGAVYTCQGNYFWKDYRINILTPSSTFLLRIDMDVDDQGIALLSATLREEQSPKVTLATGSSTGGNFMADILLASLTPEQKAEIVQWLEVMESFLSRTKPPFGPRENAIATAKKAFA